MGRQVYIETNGSEWEMKKGGEGQSKANDV